jgi:flagellar basal-body rod protein FlgF
LAGFVHESTAEASPVDSGYYAICAGLQSRMQALDLMANNLANVNTTGFKGQEAMFRSMVQQAGSGNAMNQAVNDYGVVSGTALDLSAGNIEATGNDLDLAIEGKGFFPVRTAAGVRYTRNGRFQLTSQGQLVTADGDPVIGSGGPITLPAGKISISGDGTVSVNGAVAGQLKLVDFAPGAGLRAEGASYFNPDNATAVPAMEANIRQGALEASNVSSVGAAVGLVALQRHAEMLQQAFSVFHSQFDRIAAEDLPKVS